MGVFHYLSVDKTKMGGKWVPEHPPSMRACQQFPLASFATIIIVAFVCGEQLQLTQAMPTFSMTKAMEAHKPIWFPAFKDGLPSQASLHLLPLMA